MAYQRANTDGVRIYGEYADETGFSSAYSVNIPTMSADQDDVTTLSSLESLTTHPKSSPYNDLPKLPPTHAVETIRTLKKSIAANKALAELKTAGGLIPNQALLIRAIVLQEAKLSSEIENIVTTNDELYRAFSDDPERTDPSTKEVLRYEEGLWHGYQHICRNGLLTSRLFVEIAQTIKQQKLDVRKLPGTRVVNRKTGEPIYSPPEGERLIRDLLDNLSTFLYEEDDIDPLIKMAIAHYQFEAIHPFPDGNGRTGRVLNILYLVEQELLGIPVLYLSKYIIQNKAMYYEGLRRVTEEGAWEDWIVYMLEGIEQTARETKIRIDEIKHAIAECVETARSDMKKGYSKELIELIFQQPYTRISALEEANIAKRDTASLYLRELERIGVLKGFKHGREMLYLNVKLLDIITR